MRLPDPDDLSTKLRAWKVEPQVPSSFQRQVWQRIALRQAAREEAFWPALLRACSLRLARPAYAVAVFALLLSVGIGFAHREAMEENARNWKALETRYAESVNPLAMAR